MLAAAMTHSVPQPDRHDAVLGTAATDPAQSTDAVLGGGATQRSRPNWRWGNAQAAQQAASSLYGVIQQSLYGDLAQSAIFCQLSPDLTFMRPAVAMSAPRHQAHVRTTQHHAVSLLWGFYDRDRRMPDTHQRIWYNLFYFQRAPLRCFLGSIQAGFVYWQLGETVKAEWEYHFETAFGRCPIVPNSHHIMAHMAQFHPQHYAAVYRAWQVKYSVEVPPMRQFQLQESAIDAVIDLANYYLWFQMQL